jgi:hypothetical protein
MATRKTTNSDAVSSVLDKIPAEQILNPQPLYLQVGAERYPILPMPDSALMVIGDTLSQTAGFVEHLAEVKPIEGGSIGIAEVLSLAPLLGPELVCLLVPSATKIIAACLRKDEQWVQDNLRVHQRLEALQLILEAEHLPTILAAFTKLVSVFQRTAPATPETLKTEPETPVTSGTEAPSTNSSPASTAGASSRSES